MRCRRYAVVYGRVSTRKHKRWEDDGVLVCRDRFAMLQTEVLVCPCSFSSFFPFNFFQYCNLKICIHKEGMMNVIYERTVIIGRKFIAVN